VIPKKHIYVYCPYNCVTGGPDALHQMVYYLNSIDSGTADIVYFGDEVPEDEKDIVIPVPYQRYVTRGLRIQDVPDMENICCVFPETYTSILLSFKKAKKFVWWLSVNNGILRKSDRKSELRKRIVKNFWKYLKRILTGYYLKNKGRISKTISGANSDEHFDFQKDDLPGITHLCASYFAYDFVSQRTKNPVYRLIEPISKEFLEEGMYVNSKGRRKVVLYNPKKGPEFSSQIIKKAKDVQFVPLTGFSWKELIEQYRTAVLYMDFGPFPGAERMPKEAVYNGCLIITGKNGASAYHGDVPIPEEDKFDAKKGNIPAIINRIRYLLNHYDEEIGNFQEYRNTVNQLEPRFIQSLKDVLLK
jgi:hypothetical protein